MTTRFFGDDDRVRVEDRDVFDETVVSGGNDGASDIVSKAETTDASSVTGIGFLSSAIKFTVDRSDSADPNLAAFRVRLRVT